MVRHFGEFAPTTYQLCRRRGFNLVNVEDNCNLKLLYMVGSEKRIPSIIKCSLPNRQLRNYEGVALTNWASSLPNRQLRNLWSANMTDIESSLPNRQLRDLALVRFCIEVFKQAGINAPPTNNYRGSQGADKAKANRWFKSPQLHHHITEQCNQHNRPTNSIDINPKFIFHRFAAPFH